MSRIQKRNLLLSIVYKQQKETEIKLQFLEFDSLNPNNNMALESDHLIQKYKEKITNCQYIFFI